MPDAAESEVSGAFPTTSARSESGGAKSGSPTCSNAVSPPAQRNLPIPDEQLGVCGGRDGDGARTNGLPEIGTQLVYDQLFHAARYGGSFEIHEVRGVGRVDDEAPRNRANS